MSETNSVACDNAPVAQDIAASSWPEMQIRKVPMRTYVPVEVKVLDERFHQYADKFRYGTPGSAATDIIALPAEDVTLQPGESALIGTGIAIWTGSCGSNDLALVMLPRSGLGSRGLVLGNLVGLIDADYQGELKICLWNRGDKAVVITPGMAVAQATILPTYAMRPVYVDAFSNETVRGEGGFGHTDA